MFSLCLFTNKSYCQNFRFATLKMSNTSLCNLLYTEHKSIIIDFLTKCYANHKYLNIVFICKDSVHVEVHQSVIISVSNYLKRIIRNEDSEIIFINHLPDVESSVVKILVELLYEGYAKVNRQELGFLEELLTVLDIRIASCEIQPCVTITSEAIINVEVNNVKGVNNSASAVKHTNETAQCLQKYCSFQGTATNEILKETFFRMKMDENFSSITDTEIIRATLKTPEINYFQTLKGSTTKEVEECDINFTSTDVSPTSVLPETTDVRPSRLSDRETTYAGVSDSTDVNHSENSTSSTHNYEETILDINIEDHCENVDINMIDIDDNGNVRSSCSDSEPNTETITEEISVPCEADVEVPSFKFHAFKESLDPVVVGTVNYQPLDHMNHAVAKVVENNQCIYVFGSSDARPTYDDERNDNIRVSSLGSIDMVESVPSSFSNTQDSMLHSLKSSVLHTNADNEKMKHYYKCYICHKMFTRSFNMKMHINVEHNNLRYECAYCHRKFTRPQNLKTHIDMMHRKINKYVCHVCHKFFPCPSKLRKHIEINRHWETKNKDQVML